MLTVSFKHSSTLSITAGSNVCEGYMWMLYVKAIGEGYVGDGAL